MITVQPLIHLDSTDISRIVTPYVSEGVYVVHYRDSPTDTSFELQYVTLPEPSTRNYDHFNAAT